MGARFSTPVQTGPGAHPASCTMGTGSFPGVKSGRGVTLTPHPLLVPFVHERLELYLYSPYGPYGLYRASVPVQGCTFYLFLQYTRTESQPFVVFVRTVLCLMVLSVSQTTTRMASNSCVIGMNVIGYWRKPLWICMNI